MSRYQNDPTMNPFNSPSKKGLHPHLSRSSPEKEKDYSAYEGRSDLLKVMGTSHPQLGSVDIQSKGFVDNIADAIKTHPILSLAGLAAIGMMAYKAVTSGSDDDDDGDDYSNDRSGRLRNPSPSVVYMQNPEPRREVICFPQSQVIVKASDTPAAEVTQSLSSMATSTLSEKTEKPKTPKFSLKERKRRSKRAKSQKRSKGGTFK